MNFGLHPPQVTNAFPSLRKGQRFKSLLTKCLLSRHGCLSSDSQAYWGTGEKGLETRPNPKTYQPGTLSKLMSFQLTEILCLKQKRWKAIEKKHSVSTSGLQHTHGHLHSHVHVHRPVLTSLYIIHITFAYHTHTHSKTSRRNARQIFFCIGNEMLKSVIFKLNFIQLPWIGQAQKRNWTDLFS